MTGKRKKTTLYVSPDGDADASAGDRV